MVRGAFKSFVHRHTFRQEAGGTVMVDDFTYTSPLGLLRAMADKLFLGPGSSFAVVAFPVLRREVGQSVRQRRADF
jgi:hypothetical protein